MIGGFNGVRVGWRTRDLLKRVFRGKTLGTFIGPDLLAPNFLQDKRPKLITLNDSQIEIVVVVSGDAVIDEHLVRLSIAEKMHAICTVPVGLLSLDQSRQKSALGLPFAEQVEDRCEVAEFKVELQEAGGVCWLFGSEDFGAVGEEVERHRQSKWLLGFELKFVVFEERLAAVLDDRDDFGLAIVVEGDWEDGVEDLFIRDLLTGAVGVALLEVGNLDVFGCDARVRAGATHYSVLY